ncbi:MAG: helicase-associated domain-containing protein [Phycisphaerae bacterium]|nr:helicase-associated domain-containing protein [Phycisphaerae bacterium]
MKIYSSIDWNELAVTLESWEKLPLQARQIITENKFGTQFTKTELGEHEEILIEEQFLIPIKNIGNHNLRKTSNSKPAEIRYRFRDELRSFVNLIVICHKYPIFKNKDLLIDYLENHYTRIEMGNLVEHNPFNARKMTETLCQRVTFLHHLDNFVTWKNELEDEILFSGLTSRHVTKASQKIIRYFKGEKTPESYLSFYAKLKRMPRELFDSAISMCLSNVLIFFSLNPETLDLEIGIWPPISQRLHKDPAKAPKAVKAVSISSHPFLIEDMASFLIECESENAKLKADGQDLYAKSIKEIKSLFLELHETMEQEINYDDDSRFDAAEFWLFRLNFLNRTGRPGKNYLLTCSQKGIDWLCLCEKEKLKYFLDYLRNRISSTKDSYEIGLFLRDFLGQALFLDTIFYYKSNNLQLLVNWLIQTLKQLGDNFVPLEDFIEYQVEQCDPFNSQKVSSYNSQNNYPDARLEKMLNTSINAFLAQICFPLYCVELGLIDKQLCIRLTDAGRYLLNLQDDFEFGNEQLNAEIIIGPDFSVTFMAPSIQAETALSKFAERKGRKIGTIFKITRQSILAASVKGISCQQVIDTLTELSITTIPENIIREITGWFGQCRNLQYHNAILIKCANKSDAILVAGHAGNSVHILNDTIVEIPAAKSKQILKKLRQEGIVVKSQQ